jgi:hypothetical protein
MIDDESLALAAALADLRCAVAADEAASPFLRPYSGGIRVFVFVFVFVCVGIRVL